MDIDDTRFEVRLAGTAEEIAAAQRLRYRVFVEEMGAKVSAEDHAAQLEQDQFDPYFDHLILIDHARPVAEPRDRVIGVYRLMRGEAAAAGVGFYGASEYDLAPLVASGRKIVELGRSCVAAPYRGGAAMHLMWNGLADYVLTRGIDLLFGVASFHGTDPRHYAQALSYLHQNHLAPADIRVRTQPDHFVDMNLLPPDQVSRKQAMLETPALIKGYLRLGGFVGDGAYIDHGFNTVDICLIMDTARMTERYRSQYISRHGAGKS